MRCVEGSGVIVALLSCFSEVKFDLQIDSPNLDEIEPDIPELRSQHSGSSDGGVDFDAFFEIMESAVDQAAEKADKYVAQASQAFHDQRRGIASWQHVFDVPLEHLVQSPYHCRYALIDAQLGIPNILAQCFDILTEECDTPKLFRTYISRERLHGAKTYIERHGMLPPSCDTHIVAAVLLQFLREMPEPLLTVSTQEAFLACANIEDADICARNLALLIGELPWAHRPTLARLLNLLNLLQSPAHAEKNGLNAVALSIVFAPTIVRPRAGMGANLASQQSQEMRLAAIGSGVVERIIQSHEIILAQLKSQLHQNNVKLEKKIATLGSVGRDIAIHVDHTIPEHHEIIVDIWSEMKKHHKLMLLRQSEEKQSIDITTVEGYSFSMYSEL